MKLSYLNCAQLHTQVRYMVNRDPATKRALSATKRGGFCNKNEFLQQNLQQAMAQPRAFSHFVAETFSD
jgi:N-formylglutamate amidohydrolase